jgi:Arc/MetJ-type ribon-helix-helix transcriptional regulator
MKTVNAALKKPGRPRKSQTVEPQFHQITVHLSLELVSALDDEKAARGLQSRSELIREACRHYLEQRKGEKKDVSATQRMRNLSAPERRAIIANAAEMLAEYYRTDPEIAEWQALDGEDVYDIED